jgi:uncharacterized protein (DUF2147 family)
MKKTVFAALLGLASSVALAQMSPVGLWRHIDDETKTEKSLVRITESGGVLTGKVEKMADPAKATANCEKCTDERKGKPIVGMTILRGVKPSTDAGAWEGGDILDPNNGKVYRVRMAPQDGGKTLQVRGYLGPFYRTQVWQRVE